MKENDIDGDGRSEIVVSSPWGLGVLGLSGNALSSQMLRPNGTRIGDWLLQTAENQFGPIAKFGPSSSMEVLAKSGWGIGLLNLASPNGRTSVMAPNGTRFGGWLLNTANDAFGPAGDFDGDGQSELIVSSGWGLGLLKRSGAAFDAPFMAPNGTKLGDWLLNTPDNRFGPVGDFDGDGSDEILVQSLWGIGVLKLKDGQLRSAAMLPNGGAVGAWKLDVNTCRFLAVGNFAGGNAAHILAVDAGGIAILRVDANAFALVARIKNGTYCGGWMVNTAGDRFGPAADFDGDGAAEILVSSNWGLGVLKLAGSALSSIAIAPNGTRLGDWMLNTRSDRLNRVGHYSGSPQAEILASSGWGAGLLKVSGRGFTSLAMAANQTKLGDWRLNTADNDLEHGDQQCHAVVLHHPEWQSSADNTVSALRRRGYTVHHSDDATTGLKMLRLLAMNLHAGDRVLVYLGGHGWMNRAPGDFSQSASDRHEIKLKTGILLVRDLAPIFSSLGNRGVDLCVLDGSCEGGETVHRALGERYCAMATTGLWSPAYINKPDPSVALAAAIKPGKFGLWWDPAHSSASQINGQIMTQILSDGPHRLHQRLHRNDLSPLSRTALMARTTISNLVGASWQLSLEAYGCYLLKYINPDLPADRKARLTTSLHDYLSLFEAIIAPQRPLINEYKRLISDFGVIHQAGFVYAANYDAAWRLLADDPQWHVRADPKKHSDRMWQITPDDYQGEDGFRRLATRALNTIVLLEQMYFRQISLMRQMDEELQKRWRFEGVPAPKFKVLVQPKKTWRSYLEQNKADLEELRRFKALSVRFPPLPVSKLLDKPLNTRSPNSAKLAPAMTVLLDKHLETVRFGRVDMDKVRELADQINALFTTQYCYLSRLNIELGLVEDAIVCVHARSAPSPSEIVNV